MTPTAFAARPLIQQPEGVYVPEGDSRMLLEAFERHGRAGPLAVLDLCCGSGVQGVAAALDGHRVVAVDADRRAVSCTQRNAVLNGVHIAVRRGDLFEPVAGERFDAILANPPYVPTPPTGRVGRHVWCDGGPDGRALIDRICEGVAGHLTAGGSLWMVQSSIADTGKTCAMLRRSGFSVERVAEREHPFGPISVERLEYLRDNGFADGDRMSETLTVLRATRD